MYVITRPPLPLALSRQQVEATGFGRTATATGPRTPAPGRGFKVGCGNGWASNCLPEAVRLRVAGVLYLSSRTGRILVVWAGPRLGPTRPPLDWTRVFVCAPAPDRV